MTVAFHVIRLLVCLYNVISVPIFLLLDRPFRLWRQVRSPRSRQVADNKWVAVATSLTDPMRGFRTAAQLFQSLGSKYGDRKCLGYRQVLEIEHVSNPGSTAKIVRKRLADEYTWLSYREVDSTVQNMMRGFSSHGIQSGDKVLLALETRPEWLMTAMSVIRMGGTLCTVYSTCGMDGIVHAVNETACSHVVTNQRICKSIMNSVNQMPGLKKIIIVEDQLVPVDVVSRDGVEILTMSQVRKDGQFADVKLTNGKACRERNGFSTINGNVFVEHVNGNGFVNNNGVRKIYSPLNSPDPLSVTCRPDDLALIMYTSGTTGVPKGVMFTQKSLIEAYKVVHSIYNTDSGHRFEFAEDMSDLTTARLFAYLPTAHIFELCLELFTLSLGAHIGYGSPFTAFQSSTGLMDGTRGDAESLDPTFTIAVPLVCERIKASICEQVAKKSPLIRQLFHFGIEYKHFWNSHGFSTPLADKILFDKTKRVFGNKLKGLVVGGAALAKSTHLFLRSALNLTVAQGYGATESFALTSVQSAIAYESDCGHPHSGVEMVIEDWEEGNYRTTDQPNPRGELVVGGRHISTGYFKREGETRECFYADKKDPSMRWFRTGDIVEVDKKLGTITIIDRKKDLVKLMNGEFVALGQLESRFRDCPFASNLLVYGSSSYASTIVILVPDEAALRKLVDELKLDPQLCHDLAQMCSNQQIIDTVTQSIYEIAGRSGLSRAEKPAKVILVPDQWTPENGLTTASLKNRRKQLVDKYADTIRQAYQSPM